MIFTVLENETFGVIFPHCVLMNIECDYFTFNNSYAQNEITKIRKVQTSACFPSNPAIIRRKTKFSRLGGKLL